MKDFLKFIMFKIIALMIFSNMRERSNSLLLIRLDAIGDYILFRNFIEILRKSPKYKDFKIILIGNIAWKDLAEHLDKDFINEFIWIDVKKFHKNLIYRYKKLKEIAKIGYEVVIHPTYSRTLNTDFIVKVVTAKEKIGNSGDLSNIKAWQKEITDKWYTKLLPARKGIVFEFIRNKEFFENLLKENVEMKKPIIELDNKSIDLKLPEKYAILFIGAGAGYRKWNIEYFAEVGRYLKNRYGYEIVLCGGPKDINDANKFAKISGYDYFDLVGKISLSDLIFVIKNGEVIVSNETFAPHAAVALGVKNIFVISNGNHFGRFTPYPKEIWPYYYPIYPPEIEKYLNNYKKLSDIYGNGSRLDINNISVEKVIEKIENILSSESGRGKN